MLIVLVTFDVPVNSSVAFEAAGEPVGSSPPVLSAAVLVAPPPTDEFLAVFKSPFSYQLLPFQVSVTVSLVGPPVPTPPEHIAEVAIPPPPELSLAVFKYC